MAAMNRFYIGPDDIARTRFSTTGLTRLRSHAIADEPIRDPRFAAAPFVMKRFR
jgi:hypothetical protein